MSDTTDTRDRVIRLEEQMRAMREEQDEMSAKVTEMHQLLLQARGAKWVVITLWVVLGAVIVKATELLGFINWPPK
jgi:hypothetical protein